MLTGSAKQAFLLIVFTFAITIGVWKMFFETRFPHVEIHPVRTYDFIVVGSGAAGAVVASRLSKKFSVLLLEAGKPDNVLEIKIPAAFPKLFHTVHDWNYYTEPQKAVQDRKMYWPRGKVIGGSGSMNAMILARGHRSDWDSFDFKKMENFVGTGDQESHGQNGPMTISDQVSIHKITDAIVESIVNNGVELKQDINKDGQAEGVTKFHAHQKNGQRFSAADAYLSEKDLANHNLHVSYNSHATKIIFDGKQAIGVEFLKNNVTMQVMVNKEVILSAGAVNSPQLLLLSGVGPKPNDQTNWVHDLKGVGQNLQDHIFVTICHNTTLPSLHTEEGIGSMFEWALNGKGPLTSIAAEYASFEKSSLSRGEIDTEFIGGPLFFIDHGAVVPKGDGTTIGPILLKPRSTGYIALRSKNPFDAPIIQPNYLSHPEDLEILVQGVKRARKYYQTDPIKKYIGPEIHPGAHVQTDDQIRDFIKKSLMTIYHPTSTCKMGPSTDEMAVVNEKLEIHGLEGIRVVDASIFPNVIKGHTYSPTIMVGEKASDLILERYNKK